VLAGVGGVERHPGVPVFGRDDGHVIDVLPVEYRAIVFDRSRAGRRGRLIEPLLIDVADRDDFDIVRLLHPHQ
jgi:hypothetical protein